MSILLFGLLVPSCGAERTAGPSGTPTTSAAAPVATVPVAPAGPEQVKQVTVPAAVQALLAAPDRTEEDRALDQGRHAEQMLAFLGVRPGQKVAELAAGRGYTSELLARAVGPEGVVYVQNPPRLLKMFAEKPLAERMQRAVMKPAVRADRELDDPLPPEARDLDAVVMVLFYHDTVWLGTDRAKMNQAVFAALRKGGVYLVIDHSGRPGTGTTEAKTLHRIEETGVRKEIEQAGFRLAAEADFLRNPADARDWNDSPREAGARRGTSDRFVLKFIKP